MLKRAPAASFKAHSMPSRARLWTRLRRIAIAAWLAAAGVSNGQIPPINLLVDADFEPGSAPLQAYFRVDGDPWIPGEWNAESANYITGPLAGISPDSGTGMIRVNAVGGSVSQVSQIVDVTGIGGKIDGCSATAAFSIQANAAVAGVVVQLQLRTGESQTTVGTLIPTPFVEGVNLATVSATLDGDPDAWEMLTGSLQLPSGTRFLWYEFMGQNSTIPTGANGGVFFDVASVVLTACDDGNECTLDACVSTCACVGGQNPGSQCGQCEGGSNDGLACERDADCPGGTCECSAPVCTSGAGTCSNDSQTQCMTDAHCPALANICSNSEDFCTLTAECPPGGTCGGPGTCLFGDCEFVTFCDYLPNPDCCTTAEECDDSDPCTLDYCEQGPGACSASSLPCESDLDCMAPETCDLPGGHCVNAPITPCGCASDEECDDHDPCTTDSCEPVGTCALDAAITCFSSADCAFPGPGGSCVITHSDCKYIPLNPCPCLKPPSDLVAWYTGDTAYPEDLIGAHDGVPHGFPFATIFPKVGTSALSFDAGTSTYHSVPHAPALNPGIGDYTVDMWVRLEDPLAGYQPLISKGWQSGALGGFVLFVDANGVPTLSICTDLLCLVPVPGPSALTPNQWHFVAAVISRGPGGGLTQTVHVDCQPGMPVTEVGSVGTISPTGDLKLGADDFLNIMTGLEDEIEIFSRALSTAELTDICLVGNAGKCKKDCLLAGDRDNFNSGNDPEDQIVMRPDFAAWVNGPGTSNAILHGGVSMPFDAVGQKDWGFGYSFLNLPDICCPATIELRLRGEASLAHNDSLSLQFSSTPPAFAWGIGLNTLFNMPGNAWSTGDEMVVTLDLCALPMPSGGTITLAPLLQQDGYLDIYIQDDTSVDYIDLCFAFCGCTQPPPGMIAWWPLDEQLGSTAADIVGPHHANYTGSPVQLPNGQVGGALDATSGDAQTAGAPFNFGLGDFSIDAWVKLQTGGGEFWIVDRGFDFHFASSSSTVPHLYYQCGHMWWGSSVPLNVWHHLAVTVEHNTPGGLKKYLNGNLVGTDNVCNYFIDFGTTPLTLGGGSAGGVVDEIEIFDRALSQAEVRAIVNAGREGKCKPECAWPPDDMIAWWPGDLCGPEDLFGLHDGSYLGFPICAVNRKVGTGALYFDSPSTYIQVPDHPQLELTSAGLTVDAWIYLDPVQASALVPVVTKAASGTGYSIVLLNQRLFAFVDVAATSFPAAQSVGIVPFDTWTHLAVTFEPIAGNLMQLQVTYYIDGAPSGGGIINSPGTFTNSDPLLIGSNGFGDVLNGLLDEVEIFRRALTHAEIEAIYDADSIGKCRYVRSRLPTHLDAEPAPVAKSRFISIALPGGMPGNATALRAELAVLHRPANPPTGTPDFSAFEGAFRYVNSFGGSTTCMDSATFGTSYRCGTLGCQPEYRDWATELAGEALHITGDSVVPSSTILVSMIDASCGAAPSSDACALASASMELSTSRWGDVGGGGGGPSDGSANVIDIGLVVDNVKGLISAVPERRAWMKNPPNPSSNPVNVIDIGLTVDAVKGLPYPYSIAACP